MTGLNYTVHSQSFEVEPSVEFPDSTPDDRQLAPKVMEWVNALERRGHHPVSLSHTFWKGQKTWHCHAILITIGNVE